MYDNKISADESVKRYLRNSRQTQWSGWCCDRAGRLLWGRAACGTPNCPRNGQSPTESDWHWCSLISASSSPSGGLRGGSTSAGVRGPTWIQQHQHFMPCRSPWNDTSKSMAFGRTSTSAFSNKTFSMWTKQIVKLLISTCPGSII